MKIGLTGNIASGKSTVSSILRQAGLTVIDADLEAHSLYKESPELCQKLASIFGQDILHPSDGIHRPTLGAKVFGNAASLEQLNQCIRPYLRQRLQKLMEDALETNPHVVMDAALIYEGSMESWFDTIWLVHANAQTRLKRAIQRGMDPEDAQKRMQRQMSDEEKQSRANRIIYNEGNLHQLQAQVQNLLIELNAHS